MNWHQIIISFKTDLKKDFYCVNTADSPAHLLVAEEIFRKVLDKHYFKLWRFHRQFVIYKEEYVNVKNRNEFKFKFYASIEKYRDVRKTFEKVMEDTQADIWDIIDNIDFFSCLKDEEVSDDCDDSWSLIIKQIWPYYINGVSRAWLKAIDELWIKETRYISEAKDYDIYQKLNLYKMIAGEIKRNWIKHANDSFFHHANALFGYHGVDVRWYEHDTRLKTYKTDIKKEKGFGKKKIVYGEVKF